jgi:hypothetical protein
MKAKIIKEETKKEFKPFKVEFKPFKIELEVKSCIDAMSIIDTLYLASPHYVAALDLIELIKQEIESQGFEV